MDEEEKLVLKGFADIVKNNKTEKYAKGLVRTSSNKREHQLNKLSAKIQN